ncbi:hypothetical protein DMB38_19930 [Streptomyces sp. WAC 06738]|uniref:hypothetical protein n=1 Tax=Streptomyces sp. WAC 06738 TaxID=2203210 RepID=UPI000F6ED307|nr:hypothetical protein [Streptomyces sp. WAC 06738]AZM47747.1 hypothetical protein DMB38_19930 [Streptomyces sp. WAC 06738]
MARLTVTGWRGVEGEEAEEFSPWYFDTENVRVKVENETDLDGQSNNVSRTTGDEFSRETLYVTAKGRLAVRFTSQWQGQPDQVEQLEVKHAVDWLVRNGSDPSEYEGMPEEVVKEYQSREG